ncbi:hypothetical protein Ciccas_007004 [Cichlidogyrus casuarinus]|uniref:Uncharacterized protein n=1 Tax=Cichlidogyrus casuarinus TaxID=1844966 RepID=A0ABD2Q440_9PLAT
MYFVIQVKKRQPVPIRPRPSVTLLGSVGLVPKLLTQQPILKPEIQKSRRTGRKRKRRWTQKIPTYEQMFGDKNPFPPITASNKLTAATAQALLKRANQSPLRPNTQSLVTAETIPSNTSLKRRSVLPQRFHPPEILYSDEQLVSYACSEDAESDSSTSTYFSSSVSEPSSPCDVIRPEADLGTETSCVDSDEWQPQVDMSEFKRIDNASGVVQCDFGDFVVGLRLDEDEFQILWCKEWVDWPPPVIRSNPNSPVHVPEPVVEVAVPEKDPIELAKKAFQDELKLALSLVKSTKSQKKANAVYEELPMMFNEADEEFALCEPLADNEEEKKRVLPFVRVKESWKMRPLDAKPPTPVIKDYRNCTLMPKPVASFSAVDTFAAIKAELALTTPHRRMRRKKKRKWKNKIPPYEVMFKRPKIRDIMSKVCFSLVQNYHLFSAEGTSETATQ